MASTTPGVLCPFPPAARRSRPHLSRCLYKYKSSSEGSSLPKLSSSDRFLSDHAPSASQSSIHELLDDKPEVFFLDVNSLCYKDGQPSLLSFGRWISKFFSKISLRSPVIAVLDGEYCNNYRRQLLPSYKAHRRKSIKRWHESAQGVTCSRVTSIELKTTGILHECNVPVVKVKGYEADDIIATFTDQALQKGHRVVIASPDKDFKQLLSKIVQIVIPIPEQGRWSFYTYRHYKEQFKCEPSSDLCFRCMVGDETDGVPGLQSISPGFGRKTALKLMKKHGSLADLLSAAAVRTVGRQYVQDALTTHADFLWRNLAILSLRRNADVVLKGEWLVERDGCNDSAVLSKCEN